MNDATLIYSFHDNTTFFGGQVDDYVQGGGEIIQTFAIDAVPLSRALLVPSTNVLSRDHQWELDLIEKFPLMIAYQRRHPEDETRWKTWTGRLRPDYAAMACFNDTLTAAAYAYKLLKVVETLG